MSNRKHTQKEFLVNFLTFFFSLCPPSPTCPPPRYMLVLPYLFFIIFKIWSTHLDATFLWQLIFFFSVGWWPSLCLQCHVKTKLRKPCSVPKKTSQTSAACMKFRLGRMKFCSQNCNFSKCRMRLHNSCFCHLVYGSVFPF